MPMNIDLARGNVVGRLVTDFAGTLMKLGSPLNALVKNTFGRHIVAAANGKPDGSHISSPSQNSMGRSGPSLLKRFWRRRGIRGWLAAEAGQSRRGRGGYGCGLPTLHLPYFDLVEHLLHGS